MVDADAQGYSLNPPQPLVGNFKNAFSGPWVYPPILLASLSALNLAENFSNFSWPNSLKITLEYYEMAIHWPMAYILSLVYISISGWVKDVIVLYILFGRAFQRAVWPIYMSAKEAPKFYRSSASHQSKGIVLFPILQYGRATDMVHRIYHVIAWPKGLLTALRHPYFSYERERNYMPDDYQKFWLSAAAVSKDGYDNNRALVGWTLFNVPVVLSLHVCAVLVGCVIIACGSTLLGW